jgi:hypothetical protein
MRGYLAKGVIGLTVLLFLLSVSRIAIAAGPSISLPPGQVTATVTTYPGPNSYVIMTLSNVPSGFDVSNGPYNAWCVDEYHYIYVGTHYQATLYSSYDPRATDPDWPKVNYILNNKQGNPTDQQAAIWYFIDGGYMPLTASGKAMVNAALANGNGFVPGPGQTLAVIVWISSSVQVEFIEVTLHVTNTVPEYPIGPILGSVSFVVALGLFKYRNSLPTVFRFKHD